MKGQLSVKNAYCFLKERIGRSRLSTLAVAMVGQHGINLAVSLITSHFGDLVAVCPLLLLPSFSPLRPLRFLVVSRMQKICGCLLQRGTLSLQEIARATELSNPQVKNGLLVLIQHNCVQAFSVPRAAGAVKAVTQYMALFDNILHRMRFSKLLAIVREDLGAQCETLLEGLLQHGRLTFDQLVVRATSKKPEGRLTTPLDIMDETLSLEKQAMRAAALSDAERFSEIMSTGTEDSDVKTEDKQDVSVGAKRKFEVLEMDEEVQATITENEVLWRANFPKFVHCLKKKVCVENVRSRMGLDAGVVLEAIIESSDEAKDNSVKASIDCILEAVRGKPGGISMTLEHIRIVLDQLGCSSSTEDCNVFYTMELQSIIESCQNDEVESLVLTRYGKEAYRIFRLLIRKGSLVETDQISDITFVEKKTAQAILYKLWNDDFLYMQKVISIGTGQMQHFLWKVEKDSVWELVLNHMYHAALNLNLKIAHIVEQEHEVRQAQEKREQLRKSRMILELSLLKLDDALMVFHNF
ncbi:hypothetical protein Cni_G23359 [Canna indica]|uniref:DNA-directed RNA polymerase III subunit RPC3 n=1 Tax=Canna indica TaxID=4628 RepID=A0AAQ3QKD8_9LILI|nr:hypothetical protein Cni_G23359 [Canna indica]